eukprot:1608982-Prymnesium_polylepis.1
MGSQRPNVPPWDSGPWCSQSDVRDIRDGTPRTLVPPTTRDHQTSRALALAPHGHAHDVRLAILRAPDAPVALRFLRHAHAMMRELRVWRAVLRTGTTSRGNR